MVSGNAWAHRPSALCPAFPLSRPVYDGQRAFISSTTVGKIDAQTGWQRTETIIKGFHMQATWQNEPAKAMSPHMASLIIKEVKSDEGTHIFSIRYTPPEGRGRSSFRTAGNLYCVVEVVLGSVHSYALSTEVVIPPSSPTLRCFSSSSQPKGQESSSGLSRSIRWKPDSLIGRP